MVLTVQPPSSPPPPPPPQPLHRENKHIFLEQCWLTLLTLIQKRLHRTLRNRSSQMVRIPSSNISRKKEVVTMSNESSEEKRFCWVCYLNWNLWWIMRLFGLRLFNELTRLWPGPPETPTYSFSSTSVGILQYPWIVLSRNWEAYPKYQRNTHYI